MSNFDDYITGEQGGIPWPQAAAFFVELRDIDVPEPVLTKGASAGLLKLARINKVAQTPEEAVGMTQQAAMTDPNVVAALDYQEMAAERAALQQTVQSMQQQVAQATQAQQAAEQQVQQLAANTEALQQQVEQANIGRQAAIEQAVQAKDQTLEEVVNQQQHRAQIMQAADQLAMQLKQVAATSPNEAMAQQAAQQQAEQQAAGVEGEQPLSAKAQRETQQAQQAQVNSQIQGEQAAIAQQEDAAKQEYAVQQQQAAAQGQTPGAAEAVQQQQGAAGAPMPKQSADTVAEAAWRMGVQKLAYFYLKDEGTLAPDPVVSVAHPEWSHKVAQQRREHFENFIAMAERKKGKPLTKAEADVVVRTYNRVTGEKVPLASAWSSGSVPFTYFEKTAAGRLKGLARAYRLGGIERNIRTAASNLGMEIKDVPIGELNASERVAYHLGKHRNKYLAGGALAIGSAGALAAAGAQKRKTAADICPNTGEPFRGPGRGPGIGRPHGTGPGLGLGPGEGRGRTVDICPNTGEPMRGPGRGPGIGRPHGTGPGRGLGPGEGRGRAALAEKGRTKIEKTSAPLGIAGRLAYAGGGAAIGAGHAALEQAWHDKKFGKGTSSNDEIDRRADQAAAAVKAKRDPTYLNKLRYAAARYKADLEQADREHPGGAIARGAVKGALIGGLGAGAIHSLGGRIKSLVKAQRAAKAIREVGARAAS